MSGRIFSVTLNLLLGVSQLDQITDRPSPVLVRRYRNQLKVLTLGNPRSASDFNRAVAQLRYWGFRNVIVDVTGVKGVYPNTCVPVSAAIQLLREQGTRVTVKSDPGSIIKATHFDRPQTATEEALGREFSPLAKVWEFRDEYAVSKLVSSLVDAAAEKSECDSGVLLALEWCLNEVMDNVLQHSMAPRGFVMLQVHPEARRLCVCVVDTGVGIFRSLGETVHRPTDAIDAITMAVKKGVTRDPNVGQGNGLWGLLEIVKANQGRLNIISGPGLLYFHEDRTQSYGDIPVLHPDHQGTIVDFQIEARGRVDIAEVLGGHRPVNLRLESLEDERGEYRISVSEFSHGTGTRRAAILMRNRVTNVIAESGQRVVLDFADVGIISSSYADELLGKLVVRYGFVGFSSLVRMEGMNETVRAIADRSVAQRIAEYFQTGLEPATTRGD